MARIVGAETNRCESKLELHLSPVLASAKVYREENLHAIGVTYAVNRAFDDQSGKVSCYNNSIASAMLRL